MGTFDLTLGYAAGLAAGMLMAIETLHEGLLWWIIAVLVFAFTITFLDITTDLLKT